MSSICFLFFAFVVIRMIGQYNEPMHNNEILVLEQIKQIWLAQYRTLILLLFLTDNLHVYSNLGFHLKISLVIYMPYIFINVNIMIMFKEVNQVWVWNVIRFILIVNQVSQIFVNFFTCCVKNHLLSFVNVYRQFVGMKPNCHLIKGVSHEIF
jgi:hypothetical protein